MEKPPTADGLFLAEAKVPPASAMKPLPKHQLHPDIRKALIRRRPSADSEQLLLDLIEVWGGTRKLALDLKDEFKAAPQGGMARTRILELIHRLVISNTTHDIGRTRPASEFSDDEIAARLGGYLERIIEDRANGQAATPAGQ
jgi:hypothetical protein